MQDNPVVLCDANVLYGQWLRDLVMWLGSTGLIQPRWSETIEQEWIGNLLSHRPDLERARVERTAALMNQVLPKAKVVSIRNTLDVQLPDPDDVHVLQAAVTARASYLLTFNLSDFPEETCQSLGVTAIHPDSFLVELAQLYQEEMRGTLIKLQRQKLNPPVSWEEMTQAFTRAGLLQFAALLKGWSLLF